jgi:tetratricopeptide (TPR) repeat protein
MKKGIELYENGKYKEALRHFRSLQVDEDSYAEVSYYLGLCYAQLEQFDEALIYLDQVVAAAEDFAQVYQSRMLIGYIYANTGRYRLAEYEFQHLLDEGYDSSKVMPPWATFCINREIFPPASRTWKKHFPSARKMPRP